MLVIADLSPLDWRLLTDLAACWGDVVEICDGLVLLNEDFAVEDLEALAEFFGAWVVEAVGEA